MWYIHWYHICKWILHIYHTHIYVIYIENIDRYRYNDIICGYDVVFEAIILTYHGDQEKLERLPLSVAVSSQCNCVRPRMRSGQLTSSFQDTASAVASSALTWTRLVSPRGPPRRISRIRLIAGRVVTLDGCVEWVVYMTVVLYAGSRQLAARSAQVPASSLSDLRWT